MLLVCLAPTLADATVPVPVTANFRYDGSHSDLAQQYYHLWLAGADVPLLNAFNDGGLPAEIDSVLHKNDLYWYQLPGLLQRALLWDRGFAIALDGSISPIYTRCGRSMAQILVPRKAYERIGCTPKPCSVSTGELFYRHKWCDGDQAAAISLCATAVNSQPQTHAGMWGEGADADAVPEVTLQRHTWRDHGDDYLMFALHTQRDDIAYNFCPARPSMVIPCAPLGPDTEQDNETWCRPRRGPIVDPWVQNFANKLRPENSWLVIEFAFMMMLVGSTAYGLTELKKNKRLRAIRELELQEALLAEYAERRRQQQLYGGGGDDDDSETDAEVLERALDAAAYEHFESSIALSASASSSALAKLIPPDGSGSLSSDSTDDQSFHRRFTFERSLSTSSSISLLSGHRSAVAIRSFHLFESHRPICRKRVAFRDIQFKSVLSRGATGEVWLASLRGSDVAVKQLVPTKRRVLKEMEMFMAEIYLLSQLQHPHIISLVGVAWNTLEHVVMVQEWMQRGDLQGFLTTQRVREPQDDDDADEGLDADTWVQYDDLVDSFYNFSGSSRDPGTTTTTTNSRRRRRQHLGKSGVVHTYELASFCFSWRDHKLAIARGVASALAYLHSLTPQLLHRDVKSKNVLLSDAMEVKLCDFGISRRKHHMDEEDTNLTVTEAAGTMSWTAPEVLLGEDYDEKVDIYSFGVLLCEVDTCVLPYHDPASLAARLIYHPLRLMKQVIGQDLRPALSESCPPRIAKLVRACLDRDPAKRPAAYEIVEYLGAASDHV